MLFMRTNKISECTFCKQAKVISAKGLCKACYSRLQKTGSVEYKRKGKRSICMINDCESYVVSNGLCDKHRKRLEKHGHTRQTRPADWGKRESHPLYSSWTNLRRFRDIQLCKAWHEDFWVFVEEVPEKLEDRSLLRPIDDYAVIDKDNCEWIVPVSRKTEDEKEYLKNWARLDREQNPDKHKNRYLFRHYGITLTEFEKMKTDQGHVCKVCGNPETALNHHTKETRDLAVDHCHSTGKVRGLLCSKCNTALGNFKDDISLLKKAIVYLENNS